MALPLPSPQASPGQGTLPHLFQMRSYQPPVLSPHSYSPFLSQQAPESQLLLTPVITIFQYERNHSSEKKGGEHLKRYKVFGHSRDQNAFSPWCFQPEDYFWLNQYQVSSIHLISAELLQADTGRTRSKIWGQMFTFPAEIINYLETSLS